ncbi:phosphonate ABC transporter ATP-binding protein [Streptomyces sp. NPDC056361]|uniref:phosphonate ABC transporter ATP-binding protein n=1 Tax=Streptomyces sp. NPDC056361 TaxID=3345795 RepID=UPI0035DEF7BE
MKKEESVVRLTEVGKAFEGHTRRVHALDGVSFDVPAGQFVALLGPSGSGKSTLLQLLNGLQKPTSGVATVLGVDPSRSGKAELRALRRQVGFIFQDFGLVGMRSVLENVCSGALGRLRGPRSGLLMYPRKLREQALAQLDRVGLADQAFQRTDTLSGGQQQRVGIARALMQRPRILLADEPVSSLDPLSSQQVMELLADIGRTDSLTTICTLHQVDTALTWADRIVGLNTGRVVLDSPAGDVRDTDIARIYQGPHEPAVLAGVPS